MERPRSEARERRHDPILRTKLHPPAVIRDLVRRQRLHDRLDSGLGTSLTLVSAPAGYGKSVLVSQWVATRDERCAWLSLDETDSNFDLFVAYLLAAVQEALPGSCALTASLLQELESAQLRPVARSLANDLDVIEEPFLLVLDDYHHIDAASEVHNLLRALLSHPPRSMHLILITRRDPPLPIASLRAGNRVSELRLEELKFNRPETVTLLENIAAMTPSDDALASLEASVEGWPVGLRLAGLATLHQPENAEAFLKSITGGVLEVQEYLAHEVMNGLEPNTRDALSRSSIFSRFCPELCAAVGGDDAREASGVEREAFAALLRRGNLFTIALDSRGEWFRFHHLFKTLLMHDLKRRYRATEIRELHARASEWFERHDLSEEAIEHALAADDESRAARLVERAGLELISWELCTPMERLLERLPRQVIEQDPWLLILEGWSHMFRLRMPEWASVLESIERCLGDAELEQQEAKQLRACLDALRSSYAYYESDLENALTLAEVAIPNVPTEYQRIWIHAVLVRAMGLEAFGRHDDALSLLRTSLAEGRAQSPNSQVPLVAGVATAHWMAAELSAMLESGRKLERLSEETGIHQHARWARSYRAIPLYQLNELAIVDELLGRVANNPLSQQAVCFLDEVAVYALTSQARGQWQNANALADFLVDFGIETGADGLRTAGGALRAELALRQGRVAHAEHWAQGFQMMPMKPQFGFYVPELTFARVLVESNNADSQERGASVLNEIEEFARRTHFRPLLISALALSAVVSDRVGDHAKAMSLLAESLSEAEPGSGLRFFLDLGAPVAKLLERLGRERSEWPFLQIVRDGFEAEGSPPTSRKQSQPRAVEETLLDSLTTREREVLDLLAERLRDKEIAERLFVSTDTVNTHLKHIYQKLSVRNRRQAVTRATELGLLEPA